MYSISNYLFATKLPRGNLFLVQDNIIMGYLKALTKGYLHISLPIKLYFLLHYVIMYFLPEKQNLSLFILS